MFVGPRLSDSRLSRFYREHPGGWYLSFPEFERVKKNAVASALSRPAASCPKGSHGVIIRRRIAVAFEGGKAGSFDSYSSECRPDPQAQAQAAPGSDEGICGRYPDLCEKPPWSADPIPPPAAAPKAPAPRPAQRGSPWPAALTLGAALASACAAGWALRRRLGSRPKGRRTEGAGRFQFVRPIGESPSWTVWEGLDPGTGLPVTVKSLESSADESPGEAQALQEQLRAAAQARHPDLIGIYDVLTPGRELHVVYEFVPGRTVRRILDDEKRIPLAEACRILGRVCGALDYIHGRGLVHHDVKPSNILVSSRGNALLLDLGLARPWQIQVEECERGKPAVRHACVRGSPLALAPEALQGARTPLLDVFSVGLCFYEMVTGAYPFGRVPAYLAARGGFPPPSSLVPGLPPQADSVAAWALKPCPESRLQSALLLREMLAALQIFGGRPYDGG
jgi:hypothetical protein